MKRILFGALGALALTATTVVAEYPEKEIQGIIQWGAGGSTDTVMRSVTPHAEAALGGTVVMQNMTGAVGAIALNHVAGSAPDGYTLLMGAENPMLYKVMGLGDKDYGEFVPVSILARGTPILVARPDAPYNDYAEMIAYIAANPGEVKFGSTGPGGLPSVVTAMIASVEGSLDVTAVPYDGDGPALTALQGEFNDGYSTYLPWGPFFGVFVPKGTPDDVVAKLSAAYATGAQHPDFVQLMDDRGFTLMSISGDEANAFLSKWQQGTAWLLHDAGLSKASPEEFGIARPGN